MTFRESITYALLDEGGIGGTLKNNIKEYVCNVSFTDIVGGVTGPSRPGESGGGIIDRVKGLFGGGGSAASSTAAGSSSSVVVPRLGGSS